MKKFTILFSSLLIGISVFAFDPGKIDQKLLRLFNASFPNAKNVTWDELPNSFIISFIDNGVRTRVSYKRDGSLASNVIRYYEGSLLPEKVSDAIYGKYPINQIFGVTEVTSVSSTGSQTEYYLTIENEKSFFTVRADADGNMTIVDRFRKAK